MKKPPLLPLFLLVLVGFAAWLAYDARTTNQGERPFALLEQAREQRAAGNLPLAHAMLNRALEQAPGEALALEILHERADLCEASGAFQLAMNDYQRIAAAQPDDLVLQQKIAGLYRSMGAIDSANQVWLDLLERQPGNGWFRSQAALIGQVEWDAEFDAFEEQLLVHLSKSHLQTLRPQLRRLIHLPGTDPATRGGLAALKAELPPPAFEIVQLQVPRLRLLNQELRTEFVVSLKSTPNRNNLFAVIDSLYQAGRLTGVVDFGLAAAGFDAFDTHPGIVQDLALARNRLERSRAATLAVNSVQGKDVAWYANFLDGWCEILFDAQNWSQLFNAGDLLGRQALQTPDNKARLGNAYFYKGIAAFELGQDSDAVLSLRQFINTRTPGPRADSLGRALDSLVTSLERLDRATEAGNMLVTFSEIEPNYSARPWLYRADRAADNKASKLEEANAIARAMNADPSQTEALLERFETAGLAGLNENAISIANLALQSRNNGRWYPTGESKPYVLFALAEHLMRQGEPAGADIVLQRLLKDLPHFLPALDQRAVAQLVMGNDLGFADALLTRLEISGPDPETQAALRDLSGKLDEDRLPGPLLMRWMRMDPEFTGAIEVTRQLVLDGQDVEAYFTMSNVDRARFTDRDRLMYSDVLVALERFDTILTATAPISSKGESFVEANVLRVLAAAKPGNQQALEAALVALEGQTLAWQPGSDVDRHATLAFDALLQNPKSEALKRFAELLANAPGVRNAERMNQAALVEVLSGTPQAAQLWLTRADGLSQDGAPLAGRLLLAVMADQSADIARAVRDLRREDPEWLSELAPVYLAALENRFGEARALIEAGLNANATEARLWLASAALDAIGGVSASSSNANFTTIEGKHPLLWLGADGTKQLPAIASAPAAAGRRILAILLASEAPVWKSWSAVSLTDKNLAELLGPFGTEIQLDLALEAGQLDMADLARARVRYAGHVPFWDLFEDLTLQAVGRNNHPDMLQVRRERRAAGVPPRWGKPASAVELALDASWIAALQGKSEVALEKAQEAAQLDPMAPAVQLNLARAAAPLKPAIAQTAYLAYLLGTPLQGPELTQLFGELTALGLPLSKAQLDELKAKYPDAPEPVLARVALNMGQPAEINASLNTLEAFAKSHPALDDLSLGASQAWFDFIVRFSPERALEMAELQLDKNPRHIDPWVQRATGIDLLGDRQAALDLLRLTARMSPAPQVSIALAALLADLGGLHEEVAAALNTVRRSPDADQLVDRLEFIATASLANIGADYANQAIKRMEALLNKPELLGIEAPEIRRRLGITLLHRAKPGDGARALEHLLGAESTGKDALDRDLLHALTHLSRKLDAEIAKRQATSEN